MESHADYQTFTVSDFSKLRDAEIRTIIGAFAFKLQPEVLIPQSFVRTYGENAAGEMMLAIEREVTRRGKPEIYATATLNGGLGGKARAINPNMPMFNSDVPASVTLADNSIRRSTAPRILNFQVAQDALALMEKNEAARQQGTYTPQQSFDVTIPQSVIAAVVDANKQIPSTLRSQGFSFTAADELAFMSGYATRAGASRDIGPVSMQYPPSAVCPAKKITNQIFDPNKPDVDAALAWAAGYIQSDVDQMSPPQRSAALSACPPKMSASR
jgi:hypothetical protein